MEVMEKPVLSGASEGTGAPAFGAYVRTGQVLELKAFTGVSGDSGGYAVPREIDAAIDRTLTAISPIRRIANVVKVGSAGYRKLVTTGGTPSGWAAETDARPGTATPVFSEIVPPTGELYANPSASQAMLDDAAFDVEAWLADEIATEFARAEGAAFVGGNGTNRPKGFLTNPVSAAADATRAFGTLQYLASGAAGDFAANPQERLIDLVQALRAPYRQGATFVMNAATVARIRKFKTTDGAFSHHDPARDWQAGLQRVRRPGASGGTTLALEVPAAVSAAAAKGIAAGALVRAAAGRVRRTVPATLAVLTLAPGDVVTLSDEAGAWRVDEISLEGFATTLTCSPLPASAPAMTASAGRVLSSPDLPIGATLLYAAELPTLDDAMLTQPRLTVVASGTGAGWRAAALMLSTDGGASWSEAGATAVPGTVGTVETPLGAGQAGLIDRTAVLTVQLARTDMALSDADAVALDAGANLALVGEELLQFGRAVPLGGGGWRLFELWRGRRGTAVVPVSEGARFVLIEAATARTIDVPLATLGSGVRIMASGVGDAVPVELVVPVTGASVLPPAPVALRWSATGGGGADVAWTRRSRAGWRWLDGVDAPLGEESESYRVTIAAGGTAREEVVTSAAAGVTAAERAAGPVTVTVRQRGTFGESAAAILVI